MPTIKILTTTGTTNSSTFNVGTFDSGTENVAYMRFEIPQNVKGKVLSAKLGLTSIGGQGSITNYRLHRIIESWVPADLNFGGERPAYANEYVSKTFQKGLTGYFDGVNGIIEGMMNGSIPNYGFYMEGERVPGNTLQFAGSINVTESYRPYLEIVYNEPPTIPTLITPNGGEYINDTHSIAWSSATDTEGDAITYQIGLSTNGGSTWKLLASGVVGTSLLYDFNNEAETSMAKIRVRAYDGTSYGLWDESDGVFTIERNLAPSIPTNLTPNGVIVDRLKTQRLSWKHNDSPNDVQTNVDIQWQRQGDALWFDITSNGQEQEYFISQNTLPNGQIEWRVRTYDRLGIVSPWSNLAVFTAAEPTNAPTIIQPTGSVNVSRPIIEWASVSQSSYQLVVEDSLGATLWDTGEITSAVKARTVGVDLLNGGTYKVKVRIKDGSGLFSSFTDHTFVVSYTPPAKPIVQAFIAEGAIAIAIDHPTPTGSQPSVLYSDIYRDFDGVWVRIATNVNVAFTDYAVASGVTYKYRIQSHGNNGTFTYSDVIQASVTIKGAWIHAVRDAESTAINFRYNGAGYETEFTPESVAIKFAGRRRPVIQFGVYEDYALSVTIQSVDGMDDMNRLRSFVKNRELICYRDSDGNLLYGIIPSLPITKEYRVSSASITIIETEFNEEV